MKSAIIELLARELDGKIDALTIERLIEIPPSPDMGDFAFPCFSLARVLKKSPVAIAEGLLHSFTGHDMFEKITAISGYLNFFVNKSLLARTVLKHVVTEAYGKASRTVRVVVEFASPNTNKPLHLGHLRNMAIGESVARILEFSGSMVVRTSINNDRGVHICKSMLAYQRLGNGATPESVGKKSDHFVGDYYVLFSKNAETDPAWNDEAQKMLKRWESGDEEVRSLWKTMNGWALGGYAATYRLFGIRFDKEYFESDIFTFGKEIIREGLERGVFSTRDDGAVIIDLSEEKLGEKVLLRPDGTSVYIVQDLYLAVLKNNEFSYDRSLYVVGNEQEYHFAVLKAIFKRLGYAIADKIHHLSYGMVELPEGKMKSREGTVVDADDLIEETAALAAGEVRTRYQLDTAEVKERSLKIALAAIKYQLLRVDITKNMLFDPKKAISFEGDTGPYLLYSFARASSILRKAASSESAAAAEPGEMNSSEIALLKKLDFFPEAVAMATDKLSPSVIANYAFEAAQAFNEFYHNSPVIGSESEYFRLQLVTAFRSVLGKCLRVLGIEEIEEM
ncbi:MAG: arginine--tRNA ligase [Chitinispirillaceae bacterium]|nr:arginine--tRNA ligase [Chitinispirillaceae bacterium]